MPPMRRATVIALLAYLLLRWILATTPGFDYDVTLFKKWALFAARDGVEEIYTQSSEMDYPPLFAYILYPLGKIYLAATPEAADGLTRGQIPESSTLTALVKLPGIVFDLVIAGLLALWVQRLPPGVASNDRWTRMLPWLYLLNPVVLFDSAYWGQPDAIHSAFVLAAFLGFGWVRSAWPSWVLLTLAILMKPLAAPFFPLLGACSLVRYGFRSTLLGGLAAIGTGLLVFSPYLATGRIVQTIERVVGDVGAMSYMSTSAHNLWWALGGWQDSEVPWLGPFTATEVALVLFGLFYLGVLLLGHRLRGRGGAPRVLLGMPNGGIGPARILGLAFLVALGFFMLATHMHENHLFVAIPLLLPLTALAGPKLAWTRGLFVALSVGVFLNLVLHDEGVLKLTFLAAGPPSGLMNEHLERPFFLAELWAIRVSLGWNLALFAAVLVGSFRKGGWLERLPRSFR